MFCKKVYLPEKERVELKYTKKNKIRVNPKLTDELLQKNIIKH